MSRLFFGLLLTWRRIDSLLVKQLSLIVLIDGFIFEHYNSRAILVSYLPTTALKYDSYD